MGTCPQIATGTITVSGQQVQIWAGTRSSKPAPILFYWHGDGDNSNEAETLMSSQISEITAEGGVVASFTTSTGMGTSTGGGIWYTGDFAMADQILACAMAQLNIEARQIYTAGCSAGAFEAATMVFSRSSYLAAAMTNAAGTFSNFYMFQDRHAPSLITTHGDDSGGGVISFSGTCAMTDMVVTAAGGYAVDCNRGGLNNCAAPASDIAAQWQFCKDHPFGVAPDPYAGGLPPSFPSYCSVFGSQRDASVSD
jgi:poly(3-hydroxybutyrate) depolymerase